MYRPPHYREDRLEVMHDLIRAYPFATLVSLEKGALTANHLPMVLHDDMSELGTLRFHLAKANPLLRECDASADVLAIFQGPHHYITPSWYPSKKEHGKVVPTWIYAVVHAHGRLSLVEDVSWLRAHLERLTAEQESGRPAPWSIGDAPESYIDRQLKGIVGFELPISRIEGKWKVSQNRTDADRMGVIRGLRAEAGLDAAAMADLVDRYREDA